LKLSEPKNSSHSGRVGRQKRQAIAGALTILIASILSVGAFSSPATAVSCYDYLIDCTSPLSAQAGGTKPCDYYAITAVTAPTRYAGPVSLSVQLKYSSGGAGTTCGSAWGRIASYNCPGSSGCQVLGGNPYAFAQRQQPNFVSSYGLSDIPSGNGNDVSKQVKDCCGGFLAVGAGALYSTAGSTILSSYTTAY
jgi:hypothetical protein